MRDAATILSIGAVSGLAAAFLIFLYPISTCVIVLSMIGLLVFHAKRTAMRRQVLRHNAVVRLRPVGEQRPAPYLTPAVEERQAAATPSMPPPYSSANASQLYYGTSNSYGCSMQPDTDLWSPTRAAVQPMTTSYSTLPSAHGSATRPPPPPSYFDQDALVAHAAAVPLLSRAALPGAAAEAEELAMPPLPPRPYGAPDETAVTLACGANGVTSRAAMVPVARDGGQRFGELGGAASAVPGGQSAVPGGQSAVPGGQSSRDWAKRQREPVPPPPTAPMIDGTGAQPSCAVAPPAAKRSSTAAAPGAALAPAGPPPNELPHLWSGTGTEASEMRRRTDGRRISDGRRMSDVDMEDTAVTPAGGEARWGGEAGCSSACGGSGLGGSGLGGSGLGGSQYGFNGGGEWPLMRASAERAPKRKASLLGILDMYQKANTGFRPVGNRLPDDASQPMGAQNGARQPMGAQNGARYPGSAAHMVASSVVSSARPLGGVGGVFGVMMPSSERSAMAEGYGYGPPRPKRPKGPLAMALPTRSGASVYPDRLLKRTDRQLELHEFVNENLRKQRQSLAPPEVAFNGVNGSSGVNGAHSDATPALSVGFGSAPAPSATAPTAVAAAPATAFSFGTKIARNPCCFA